MGALLVFLSFLLKSRLLSEERTNKAPQADLCRCALDVSWLRCLCLKLRGVCWVRVAEAGVINLNLHTPKLKRVSQRGTSGQRNTRLFFGGLDLLQTQPPFRGNSKNRNQILSEAHNPVLLCLLPFAFRLPSAATPVPGFGRSHTPRIMREMETEEKPGKCRFFL